MGWVHTPDLHIFEFEFLFNFDRFSHKLVLKVDGNDRLSAVSLVVRAVALFKIVLSSVDSAQFGQFFFRQHRRHNEGYDLGLAFLGVAFPKEYDVDFARFYFLHILFKAFGGLGPDHFSLVDTYLDALLKPYFRQILEHHVTEKAIDGLLANVSVAVALVNFRQVLQHCIVSNGRVSAELRETGSDGFESSFFLALAKVDS